MQAAAAAARAVHRVVETRLAERPCGSEERGWTQRGKPHGRQLQRGESLGWRLQVGREGGGHLLEAGRTADLGSLVVHQVACEVG